MPRVLVLIVLLFCAPVALAQGGARADGSVITQFGTAIPGAKVRVCTTPATGQPCTPLTTLYADVNLTIPLTNPVTTDDYGNYFFYVPCGQYEIEITGQSLVTRQLPDQAIISDVCISESTINKHNLLSTTHLDTIPFSPPVQGDLVTGQNLTSPSGANPAWARLALGTNKQCLTSNGTDAIWSGCWWNVYNNGALVGTEQGINLIPGSNVTLSPFVDNSGAARVDVTINATPATSVNWYHNGTLVAAEPGGDFADGTNLTWTAVDHASSRVTYTPTAVEQYQNNGTAVGAEPILDVTNPTSFTDDPANHRVILTLPTGVTSFTGDGNLSNNVASTGAITLSLANAGAHLFWGNNTNSTAAPGYEAINTASLPSQVLRRQCDIAVGDEALNAIVNAQLGPQLRLCYIPVASTVIEVDVSADAGTPNIILDRNHQGTQAAILSSALSTGASGAPACANVSGTTDISGNITCSATLQNTSLSVGDYVEFQSGTAGGTAKLMTIHIIYTVN